MSSNPNISIEFIKEYLYLDWNWRELSKHRNITLDIIDNNPRLPWDWFFVCQNPNITIEIVLKNSNRLWNWRSLSINENITMDVIEKNIEKSWSWGYISRNPNLTLNMLYKYPNKGWDWNWIYSTTLIPVYDINYCIKSEFVYLYKDITLNMIKKYNLLNNDTILTIHNFKLDKDNYKIKRYNEYLMSYRIQQYWYKAILNPYCKLGIIFINRSYDKLFLVEDK